MHFVTIGSMLALVNLPPLVTLLPWPLAKTGGIVRVSPYVVPVSPC